jgi:hypothetical protein
MQGSDGSDSATKQLGRFQAFASDLQRIYADAYNHQLRGFLTTSERLAQSLQDAMRCRQPQDVLAAEANIVATYLEGASARTRTWLELTQKVQECCATAARVDNGPTPSSRHRAAVR